MEIVNKSRELVKENKLKEALDCVLNSNIEIQSRDDLTILYSQLMDYERKVNLGIENDQIPLNKIRVAILNSLTQIEITKSKFLKKKKLQTQRDIEIIQLEIYNKLSAIEKPNEIERGLLMLKEESVYYYKNLLSLSFQYDRIIRKEKNLNAKISISKLQNEKESLIDKLRNVLKKIETENPKSKTIQNLISKVKNDYCCLKTIKTALDHKESAKKFLAEKLRQLSIQYQKIRRSNFFGLLALIALWSFKTNLKGEINVYSPNFNKFGFDGNGYNFVGLNKDGFDASRTNMYGYDDCGELLTQSTSIDEIIDAQLAIENCLDEAVDSEYKKELLEGDNCDDEPNDEQELETEEFCDDNIIDEDDLGGGWISIEDDC